jgi:hypothetical protein
MKEFAETVVRRLTAVMADRIIQMIGGIGGLRPDLVNQLQFVIGSDFPELGQGPQMSLEIMTVMGSRIESVALLSQKGRRVAEIESSPAGGQGIIGFLISEIDPDGQDGDGVHDVGRHGRLGQTVRMIAVQIQEIFLRPGRTKDRGRRRIDGVVTDRLAIGDVQEPVTPSRTGQADNDHE